MSSTSDPWQSLGRWVASVVGRDSGFINALRPSYEKVLARLHGGRGIPWTINGEPFRISPHARPLMGSDWDKEVAAFLAPRLKPGAVCLDVGANAGVYVLQFCRWTEPDGRVIAFEPNQYTREVLQDHIRMNGVQDRVEVVPAAVSDREGQAEFFFAGTSGMSRLGEANDALKESAQKTIVPMTTLDRYCKQRGVLPDWVLIDIEGYELHALRGASALLSECPELQLIVEMHPPVWSGNGTTLEDWQKFFAEHRLQPIPLMGQPDPLAVTGSVYLQRL